MEVCPLVEVEAGVLEEIRRGRRPRYAFIPGVADQSLVADLDRVMTIEKAVVARWDRKIGCRNDPERRRPALALARKRARFAFPDDFVQLVSRLTRRLSRKYDKDSNEGRGLRALHEIRIRAAPSWDAEEVELTFLFIREEDEPTFEGRRWDLLLQSWLKLLPETGRYRPIHGIVLTLDDLTARDYVESDPLDLNHLSN